MKPGIYPHLSREEYDAIDAVNLSTLRYMKKSPAHYKSILLEKGKDSDAKKLGRAVHMAVFEPERFDKSIAIWTGKVRRGKEWDDFRGEHAGKEWLTPAEYTECMTMQKVVRADPIARRYIEKGQGEVTLAWEFGGIQCKGRVDYIGPLGIPDLKTARDASPDGFGKASHEYGYHVRAAWYGDAYHLLTGEPKPACLIAVESDAPNVVQVYNVPDPLIRAGRREYLDWLDKLGFCRSQKWWPGYADQVLDLTLPKWATPIEEAAQ